MIQDFRTQTEFIPCNNVVKTVEKWPIALDIGYSAVKGMTPCCRFRFPSFAREVESDTEFMHGIHDDSYIMYKNEDGEIWKVGESAYQSLSTDDSADDARSLYARFRYSNPMFKVIIETALGFASLKDDKIVNKPIVLQTGLPPKYLQGDSRYLKEAFQGHHHFWLKHGNDETWREFKLNITADNIMIMAQPSGSLMGVALDNSGNPIKDYIKFFQSKTLVFDAGFGTLDIFELIANTIGQVTTLDNCGMKAVFEDTINKVEEKSQMKIPIHVFQNVLKDGFITVTDRVTYQAKKMTFGKILEHACSTVCNNALKRVSSKYDFTQYQYLILTGGTAEVWGDIIKEKLKNIETLTVLLGNANDPTLPLVYSNVRGYYLSSVNVTANKTKKGGKVKDDRS